MRTKQGHTPPQVFTHYLDAITSQRWEELPQLYAPDAIVEHPLGPDAHRILHGRSELLEHFTALHNLGLRLNVSDIVVHDTGNPEVIIAEFTYHGTVRTGTAAQQHIRRRNIFVITVRNGQIVSSRDYQGDA
ncbi:MAG: nuclear transport factor 2 family protein [Actinomycetota bacterium]|nr:nuclear transport factor 2 family protein [Actinomycetota bacterium]